ncbi:MAG: hypothetical protein WC728_13300 [Elusimicrobiota bacterium]
MREKLLPALLLSLALPAAASSSDPSRAAGAVGELTPALDSPGGDSFQFKMGGSAGAASITNWKDGQIEIFNALAFQPEVAIGKLGLGFDFYMYFDHDGKIRKQDWDSASDIVTKLWYARWGAKGEPVYARLGGLTDATLGHGFIMGGYSNRRRYPDVRQVGAQLDLDLGTVGFESVLTDVQRANLMGGRIFVRPLSSDTSSFAGGLALGLTAVSDFDPDGNDGSNADQVAVFGADVDLPVVRSGIVSATLYADAAMTHLGRRYREKGCLDNGRGMAAGLRGNAAFIDYKAEMRALEENFIPTFFDGFYDLDRSTAGVLKADGIAKSRNPGRRGPLIALGTNIIGKIRLGASYEDLNVDPMDVYPRVRGEVRLDPSLFMGKLDFASVYERRSTESFAELTRTRNKNTVITTEIGALLRENLRVVLVLMQTYDANENPVRTTQVRADLRF